MTRSTVLAMARFFNLPPRRVLSLLTAEELAAFAWEAMWK